MNYMPHVPTEILVDPSNRDLIISTDLELGLPNIESNFKTVDAITEQPTHLDLPSHKYLKRLESSVFEIPAQEHVGSSEKIQFSVLFDERVDASDEALVVFSPLNDCEPKSSAAHMSKYIYKVQRGSANTEDREEAQPNSWRRIQKSGEAYEYLIADQIGMPVITIFSPAPSSAFDKLDRSRLSKGDASAYGKLAERVVAQAQDMIHGSKSDTQLQRLHVHGAGLGHAAVGAASHFLWHDKYRLSSLTTPNLIAGVRSRATLLAQYTLHQHSGQAPNIVAPDSRRVCEPELLQQSDTLGSERAMRSRQLKAILETRQTKPMIRSNWLRTVLDKIAEQDVPITVSAAENARICQNTARYLPLGRPSLAQISIAAFPNEKAAKADLMTNEYQRLNTALTAIGVGRAY